MSLSRDLHRGNGQDDQTSETQWPLALSPKYARWMRFLGLAAVISTAVSEIHHRKLVAGFEMPDRLTAVVSYISFASVSMLLVGGILAAMLWLNERNRGLRR